MALIKSAQSGTLTRQAMVLDMSDLGQQAQRMLEVARKQAEQIVSEARAKAQALIDGAEERGFAQGMERGLNEGREAGHREGYEQANKDWNQRFERLNASLAAALQDWEHRRAEMMHQATEDIIAFAVEAARRVTHRVVRSDATAVRDQVAAALKLISKPTAVEIVIHPEQRALIEKDLPQLIAAIAACQHASIREDAAMMPGGCVINVAGGRVDASIETQLQRMAECFDLPDMASGRSVPDDPEARRSALDDMVARRSASCDADEPSSNGPNSPAQNDAERRSTTSDGGETLRTDDPTS